MCVQAHVFKIQVEQDADTAKVTAWGTLVGLVVRLVIGGILGAWTTPDVRV